MGKVGFVINEDDLADLYDGARFKGAWDKLSYSQQQTIARQVWASLNDYIWDSVGECLADSLKEVHID